MKGGIERVRERGERTGRKQWDGTERRGSGKMGDMLGRERRKMDEDGERDDGEGTERVDESRVNGGKGERGRIRRELRN